MKATLKDFLSESELKYLDDILKENSPQIQHSKIKWDEMKEKAHDRLLKKQEHIRDVMQKKQSQ